MSLGNGLEICIKQDIIFQFLYGFQGELEQIPAADQDYNYI